MRFAVGGVAVFFVVIELLKFLTIAQNNNYKLSFSGAFKREWGFVIMIAVLASYPMPLSSSIVYFTASIVSLVIYIRRRKKMIMTKRAIPYFILSILPVLLLITGLCFVPDKYIYIPCISVITIVSFVFIKISESIFNPYYQRKNDAFIKETVEKFFASGTKIIAITGSFGKTCCKNILKTLLEGTYNVAITEGNYNTPLGVALSMRKLKGNEDYFIAEFGARQEGDIRELCTYFPPNIGVITGVCQQHLGVFGSFHAIYEEKFKLAKMIKKEGFCAFGNNLYAKKMCREYKGNKISVGACEDIYAENVCRSIGKTSFNMHIRDAVKNVTVGLCGKQALENVLLCVAVADKLQVSAEDIFERTERLEQIPHRLEYTYANGIHILDDSYNSNSVGVRYALEYLSLYPQPRIVVCQGIVEMGIKQKEENILIGEEAAKVADYVITTGINKRSIEKGLKNARFNGSIVRCGSMKEVTKKLSSIVRPGATVLLQNDVPEIY